TSSTNKEFYLRDHTGKELGVYDLITGRIKMLNLYGNGLFGKVNVRWDSTLTETDPGTWEYVFNRTDERQFYFKDHLGSIRMTIDAATFDITGAQDYYPYGEVLRSYVTGGNINDKYKFTEKERDTETGYDYFPPGRTYDSEFGRWLQADPLNQYHSPYIYCGNNPLRIKDNDGKYGEDVHHDLTYYMAVFVMGVSGNVASEIANANQGVDININTRSENPLMWDNSLHFTSPLSIKVCDNLYNNNATLSNELFGASLHSFMDINFSHWGFFAVNSDGTLGHLNQMEVDKVARNNKLKGSSSQMIKAVYELMKQRNGGKAKISFEDLLKNLNNYITEYGDFQGIDKTVGENPKSSNDNKRAKHSWFVDPIQDWDDRYSPRN
ncbi:MAG: RHS repeat-associated core domain-containing protein, partial [Ignavibacteria bacterium]|nr:RHS repeat-associated core domain-containing protein [Ignavibacteria bacterium]